MAWLAGWKGGMERTAFTTVCMHALLLLQRKATTSKTGFRSISCTRTGMAGKGRHVNHYEGEVCPCTTHERWQSLLHSTSCQASPMRGGRVCCTARHAKHHPCRVAESVAQHVMPSIAPLSPQQSSHSQCSQAPPGRAGLVGGGAAILGIISCWSRVGATSCMCI